MFSDEDDKFIAFAPRAQAISITSASLSSLSSLLVMTFIMRSQDRLKTAYHRIMFFMSFWDIITSLAMAISTIPMPADMQEIYPFVGNAYGTITTCKIQAFLILQGSIFAISSNCMLNIYYVCTIRFRMAQERFNCIVLPLLLVLSTVISLPFPIYALLKDLLNPVPFYPYCIFVPSPLDCESEDDITSNENDDFTTIGKSNITLILVGLGLAFTLIVTSMILVVSTAYQEFSSSRTPHSNSQDNNEDDAYSFLRAQSEKKKMILRQALLYIGAFLLTWVWTVIFMSAHWASDQLVYGNWLLLDTLKFLFQPLQGFFNASIFFYAKIWSLRHANDDLTLCQATMKVATSPGYVPEITISGIDLVDNDHIDRYIQNFNMFRHRCAEAASSYPPHELSRSSVEIPEVTHEVTSGVSQINAKSTENQNLPLGPGKDSSQKCEQTPSMEGSYSQILSTGGLFSWASTKGGKSNS